MSEHREWSAEKGMGLFSTEIAEHNATVRAYRDAMAECERLGKANDDACDRIHALEQWRQETLDENNRLDRELDEARQAQDNLIFQRNDYKHWLGNEQKKVAEQTPIAAAPERASDEELDAVFEQGCEGGALLDIEGIRAVRARVEAPLLAEIERLTSTDHYQRSLDEMHLRYNVESERDTLKARVAELEAMDLSGDHCMTCGEMTNEGNAVAWQHERCAENIRLRAELEAVNAERNELKKSSELLAVVYQGEMDARKSAQSELAALRQPVDADAWKTPLRIVSNQIIGSEFWVEVRSDMAFAACMTSPRNGTGFHFHDPADAARASIWLASYATAHGCPVGLGEDRESLVNALIEAKRQRDVAESKLRSAELPRVNSYQFIKALDDAREATRNHNSGPYGAKEKCPKCFGTGKVFVAGGPERVCTDCLVPNGEPSNNLGELPAEPVSDTYKLPTRHEPTDAEVEALARVLHKAYRDSRRIPEPWEDCDMQDSYHAEASAAFAHIGAGAPAANEPNADIVLAGLEERDEPIHAHMLDEYIRGYCEANGTSPSSVSYSRTGFRYALEAMRKMLEPAAAETLEQLAEIGLTAYYASAPDNCRRKFSEISEASQQDTLAQTAAILRAAQAYVEFEYDEIISALKHANEGRGDGEWHNRMRDFMNSRIRYRVALPETPKGLPDIDHLEAIFDNTYGATKSDKKALEAVVTALRPWLHEPTGWELDVTAREFARWHQDTKHDQSANYEKFDDLGENYKEDFIVAAESSLNYLRSRIRPTFECGECAGWKAKYLEASKHADDMHARNKAARAALEGE